MARDGTDDDHCRMFFHDDAQVLSETECQDLLASANFGRIALTIRALPVVMPVNYGYLGGSVIFGMSDGPARRALAEENVIALGVDSAHLGRVLGAPRDRQSHRGHRPCAADPVPKPRPRGPDRHSRVALPAAPTRHPHRLPNDDPMITRQMSDPTIGRLGAAARRLSRMRTVRD